MYITTDTYAVVKYETFTVRTPYAIDKPKELRRLGLAAPTSRHRTHHDVYQHKQLRGTYYLHYARHDHEQVYTDLAGAGGLSHRTGTFQEHTAIDDILDLFDGLTATLTPCGEITRRRERPRSLKDLDQAALVPEPATRLPLDEFMRRRK